MASVTGADHRQGGAPIRPHLSNGRRMTSMEITGSARADVGHPMPRDALADFVMALPAEALVTVVPIMGGSQRDPETTGYHLSATWSMS